MPGKGAERIYRGYEGKTRRVTLRSQQARGTLLDATPRVPKAGEPWPRGFLRRLALVLCGGGEGGEGTKRGSPN